MERRPAENGDVVLEINSSAGASEDHPQGGLTGEQEKNGDTNGADAGAARGRSMSFSQAYKMRHRTPQARRLCVCL
jgi:hypothetical protein